MGRVGLCRAMIGVMYVLLVDQAVRLFTAYWLALEWDYGVCWRVAVIDMPNPRRVFERDGSDVVNGIIFDVGETCSYPGGPNVRHSVINCEVWYSNMW